MRSLFYIIALILSFSSSVYAGVTIHYQGELKSEQQYSDFVSSVETYCKKMKWDFKLITISKSKQSYVINENDFVYEGPVKGLIVQINEDCEPLEFIFTDKLFFQSFCKTQFAGALTHIDIINLFHILNKTCENLEITNEGEYWDTNDKRILDNHITTINKIIESKLKENKRLKSKVKLQSGRIVDLIN